MKGLMKPPTQWDRDMVELLSSLASREEPPKLRYHFFANTFPLAYHYAWALIAAEREPEEFIEYSPGFAPPEPAQWGYSTESDASASNRNCIQVSLFRPRWAFVERTLWTHRLASKIGGEESTSLSFSRFLEAIVDFNAYEHVTVYAEIPQLGTYLQGISASMLNAGPKLDIYSGSASDKTGKLLLVPYAQCHQVHSSIRLFIYGGPLSTYLLRKTNRYLALSLDPRDTGKINLELLRTVLILPNELTAAEKENLDKYHQRLYGKLPANPQQCSPFSAVYRAFNEVAWLLQSRASFRDAEEFSRCIVTHQGTEERDSALVQPGMGD